MIERCVPSSRRCARVGLERRGGVAQSLGSLPQLFDHHRAISRAASGA